MRKIRIHEKVHNQKLEWSKRVSLLISINKQLSSFYQTLVKCENVHCTYRLKARIPVALVWEAPSPVGVEQGFPADV